MRTMRNVYGGILTNYATDNLFMKARHIIILLLAVFTATSCVRAEKREQVFVSNLDESPKIVLDITDKSLEKLIKAIEDANTPFLIDGKKVVYRPCNEENLSDYCICVRKQNGEIISTQLYISFPFYVAQGYNRIYDFKHLLTKEDVKILQILIPEWQD